MQKKTQGWEPNTERLYARDEMLIGNNFMALKLEGGGHYTCEFISSYKYVIPITIQPLKKNRRSQMEVSFRDLAYVKATIRDFISKKSLDLV